MCRAAARLSQLQLRCLIAQLTSPEEWSPLKIRIQRASTTAGLRRTCSPARPQLLAIRKTRCTGCHVNTAHFVSQALFGEAGNRLSQACDPFRQLLSCLKACTGRAAELLNHQCRSAPHRLACHCIIDEAHHFVQQRI